MDLFSGLITIFFFALGILAIAQVVSIFFYPRGMRFRFEQGLSHLETLLRNKRVKQVTKDLESLGYSLLGVFSESAIFVPTVKSVVYASAEHKAFVSIASPTVKAYTCFFTPFTDGEVLLTADGYFKKIDTEDCAVQVLSRASIKQLFEAHQKRLQDFEAAGANPFAEYTQATRLQTFRMIYANPSIQRWMRWNMLRTLGLSLGVAGIFSVLCVAVFILTTIDFRSFFPLIGQQSFQSAEGGFSISMPHSPTEETSGNTHTFTARDNEFTYVVTYTDYPPNSIQAEAEYLLNEFQNQIIAEGGTLVMSQDITLGEHRGREFRLRVSDGGIFPVIQGRVYLVGDRVYRVYIRYLVPSALSKKIEAYLDSFRLLDEATLMKLRLVTPTIAYPSVEVSFVKIHDCNGSSQSPYAAFKLTNTGNSTFTETSKLIKDDLRNIYLYGHSPDVGYASRGFHRREEQCGAGEKPDLRPGETVYISLGLNTQGCTPSCNARAVIEVCTSLSVENSCVTQTIFFTVTQPATAP